MMKLSTAQIRVMADIQRRSKGWPVGIPSPPRTARALVARGIAEWAPPAWGYRAGGHCIRLTTMGEVALKYDRSSRS